VSGLELCLHVLEHLVDLLHLVVHEELVRDVERYQELGSVGLALQVCLVQYKPVENVLNSSLVALSDVSGVLRTIVARVTKYLQEAADTLLQLFLRFLGHVGCLVDTIKVSQELV